MKPSYASHAPPSNSSAAVAMHPPPPAAAGAVVEAPGFPQPYYLHPHSHHHHHQQPHPAHPPAPPVVYSKPEQQRIKTLFVSGLPDDVKPREIHNLFRRRPGFDSCQLEYTGRGDQVVAFATFFNHQSAIAAMSSLDGVVFDPEIGATLHIELARSNSRKRSRGVGAYTVIDKRVKVTNDDQELFSDDGDGGSDEPSGTDNDNPSNKDALAANSNEVISYLSPHLERSLWLIDKELLHDHTDIPPCSTLFIANLGPTCTEEELKQVLSKYSGFHMLKMRGRGGMPVAFADFTDTESSTAAMNGLQGILLESSDRGGVHVEYARSKMRKS
ncbi:unnamed protein product [Musa acuminata subsp. malaccensis]|uniref:(wild Malaysian banana) hypothetical protein n=1 Tax=Musa acuminata subsp. malaccensis TaxID=214687 RepID=A0A8D7BAF9_MUSAM|nr:unnamed protein product [Musa acuminata subsp. malaccensis]